MHEENKTRKTTNKEAKKVLPQTQKEWEEEFKSYIPSKEGLNKGILVARTAGGDEILIIYSTCFLYDYMDRYEDINSLFDELYEVSLQYAFAKKMSKIDLTEIEEELMSNNQQYAQYMRQRTKSIETAKHFVEREIGVPKPIM